MAKEEFKKVSEAYAVLSDPKQKMMYDKYGKAGLNINNQNVGGFG